MGVYMQKGIRRQLYFDKTVHIKSIKDCISGKNEENVIKILNSIDYNLGVDFVRQHPIGGKFVIDIAFINEQIAIEVDGANHLQKKQKIIDKQRDKFLRDNNWIPIRINDKEFFGFKLSFYRYLIDDIVKIRRQQYQNGILYPIDIKDFKEEDYD